MTEMAEKLKDELVRLSLKDRAELADFLLDTLDSDQSGNADARAKPQAAPFIQSPHGNLRSLPQYFFCHRQGRCQQKAGRAHRRHRLDFCLIRICAAFLSG